MTEKEKETFEKLMALAIDPNQEEMEEKEDQENQKPEAGTDTHIFPFVDNNGAPLLFDDYSWDEEDPFELIFDPVDDLDEVPECWDDPCEPPEMARFRSRGSEDLEGYPPLKRPLIPFSDGYELPHFHQYPNNDSSEPDSNYGDDCGGDDDGGGDAPYVEPGLDEDKPNEGKSS